MHLEEWQSLDRLLLCGMNISAIESLKPALQQLQSAFPKAQMTLLIPASGSPSLQLSSMHTVTVQDWLNQKQVAWLRQQAFDAALIFTEPLRSPYAAAYLCYLAGISVRVGQSQEFGGAVLTTCVTPPLEPVSSEAYHLHLLQSSGLLPTDPLLIKT